MSEQSERYVKMLRKNADKIVIGVMYGILALLIFMWYREQSGATVAEAPEPKPANLPDPVSASPSWETISAMSAPPDMTQYPEIMQIRQFNMFELKNVRSREEIERRANQKFVDAQAAVTKNQKEEALRLLNEILKEFPNHKKARELFETLSAGTAGAEATPSAGGGNPTPAQP